MYLAYECNTPCCRPSHTWHPQGDFVYISITISGHPPTSKSQPPIERWCKIQDPKTKDNKWQWICILCVHFIPISVDPLNFRTCIQGDLSLRETGFRTTAILKSYGLFPVVLLNTPHLLSLSQGTHIPPESSLESSDREQTIAAEIFSPAIIQFENDGVARLQSVVGVACTSVVRHAAMWDCRTMRFATGMRMNTHTFIWNCHLRRQNRIRILIYHLLILVKSFCFSEPQFPPMEMGIKYSAESLW